MKLFKYVLLIMLIESFENMAWAYQDPDIQAANCAALMTISNPDGSNQGELAINMANNKERALNIKKQLIKNYENQKTEQDKFKVIGWNGINACYALGITDMKAK